MYEFCRHRFLINKEYINVSHFSVNMRCISIFINCLLTVTTLSSSFHENLIYMTILNHFLKDYLTLYENAKFDEIFYNWIWIYNYNQNAHTNSDIYIFLTVKFLSFFFFIESLFWNTLTFSDWSRHIHNNHFLLSKCIVSNWTSLFLFFKIIWLHLILNF